MRVPNISIYDTSRFQLNSITNNLSDANEVISTQKRINQISDDPIGLSQVLDLRLSVDNLIQIDKNIEMGRTWVNGTETALQSIQDQILEAKLLSTKMVNASMSTSERADAVEIVDGIIDQVLALGNAQVNGSYIFSGTKTNIKTFGYDSQTNPTKAIYYGNDTPFSIKTGQTSKLEVGRSGQEVLTEDRVTVNATNNKIFFREDPGNGENSKIVLEGTIPDGNYTPETLAIMVKNAMNTASEDRGYQVTYDVSYDSSTKKFTIVNDGRYDGYMGFDLMWESGETPRIAGLNTQNIIKEGVNINVINDAALIYDTPKPSGQAPLRLTWNESSGKWKVLNDPGYGLPLELSGSNNYVELDLNKNGLSDINITLESPATSGGFVEFDIVSATNDHSIGPDLGFAAGDVYYKPVASTTQVTLKTFDHTNNVIDFQENIGAGLSSQLSAAIPIGTYSDMTTLASAIEGALENASVNNIDYSVQYSQLTEKFTIRDNGTTLTELRLLWNSGTNTSIGAASELGYDNSADDTGAVIFEGDNAVTLFTITAGTNDYINFKEVLKGSSGSKTSELTARIPAGAYTDPDTLAREIEDALEDASEQYGNRVDYDVSYSYISRKFTIKEDGETGRKLDDFQILWSTGTNSDTSAAAVLGFESKDVFTTPARSDEVAWGVFETLFELKEYLSKDDVDGISRTMTRLDTHYNSITSVLSDVGMKYNRLEIRKQVSIETKLSITERKSMIEDADIVESIMDLKAIQTAYEASLNSTSKILDLSLVNFL